MWSWLPSRAAIWAGLAALAAAALAWLRSDAARDARRDTEQEGRKDAEDIRDRVDAAGRDHAAGVRPFGDAGWRD